MAEARRAPTALEQLYTKYLNPLQEQLIFNVPPGPRIIPVSYVVNTFKAMTMPVFFALMRRSGNYTHGAYLITALHGCYGLVWFLKHFIAPDPFWQRKATVSSCLVQAVALSLYWSAGWITIMRRVTVSPPRAFLATVMCCMGTAVMLASDTQKFFVLKLRRGLIEDGWFSRCRNTNYLGEMLLYSSFGVVAQHWAPWAHIMSMWSLVFVGRWFAKEGSLRRKLGGPAYIRRSGMILPWFGGGSRGRNDGGEGEDGERPRSA